MTKKTLVLTFLILVSAESFAQHKLKRFEFPEFGISMPFFAESVKSIQNAGKTGEAVVYSYLSNKQNQSIAATMTLYSKIGCMPVDTFYNQMERFSAYAEGKPEMFRPLHRISHSYYLGWSFFEAIFTSDKDSENIFRNTQAFYNGSQMLIVDMVSINENSSDLGKEIFMEPGYQSILRPLELKSIGLRLKIRGNVASRFDEKEKRYYLGRCDRLGTLYPMVTFEVVTGEPSALVLAEAATQRQNHGFDNVSFETIEDKNKYKNIQGAIYKVITNDKSEIKGKIVHYFFKFNNLSYKASLYVPYIIDDNRVYMQSDREINAESAIEFDKRVMELLENPEKI